MSQKYPGGLITKNLTVPTAAGASGMWTLQQASTYTKDGIWPKLPGAPTIGTATAGNNACASVTFTAPSCVGSGPLTYSVKSTPGCITGTGASSPVTVSGLTAGTSYTFQAYGVTGGGTGPASAASNSITAKSLGSDTYQTAGTYSWVAPAGVTSVSVVAVGGGGGANCYGGGGGGGLGYKNNYTVTPGNSYTVVVGARGSRGGNVGCTVSDGGVSYFVSTGVVAGYGGIKGSNSGGGTTSAGGSYAGDGGGTGGRGRSYGGGGAGGYAGTGGDGGYQNSPPESNGQAGSGGAGGGGSPSLYGGTGSSGGGGVGVLGQGSSGASSVRCQGGFGGSGGNNGSNGARYFNCCTGQAYVYGGEGGYYYGGGGGPSQGSGCFRFPGLGGVGAVRIMWPGTSRSFPSTCAGSP